MNLLKIFDYEPLDRTKLSRPAKVFVWFIEYFARIMAAIYLSLALLIVSVWPGKGASKNFFRLIGGVADMYRMRWMRDEYVGTDVRETVDKADGPKVSGMENKQ